MSDGSNSPPRGRERRSSFTQNTFTALFGGRNNSTTAASGVASQPGPVTAAVTPGRRMSIAAIGLSGTSPIQTSGFGFPGGRRGSVSTAGSDSIDDSAIEDDEGPSSTSVPTTPFTRRMSIGAQALFNARGSGSPGTNGRAPSYTTSSLSRTEENGEQKKKSPSRQASTQSQPRTTSDSLSTRSAEGLNWSEQFRSRAESAVQRPSFSTSPTTSMTVPKPLTSPTHERAKSFGEMPVPPASMPQQSPSATANVLRKKPDAVGERMLRGDFYMD